MGIKFRLIVMNFLQYAVWGSYLTSMGAHLYEIGLGEKIGLFYAMQGIVSLFMPALVGIIADRWVQAQRLLGACHLLAALFMAGAAFVINSTRPDFDYWFIFGLYTASVAFYMPTIALSNSVAYSILESNKMDTVKDFPPIRVWGTVGFICAMLFCDFAGFQLTSTQFYQSALLGVVLAIYALTLPACPTSKRGENRSLVEALGLRAFTLFKQKKMAMFFIFSMLLGVSLQITNGYATPYINSFAATSNSWFANNSTMLVSLSQISEALCILLTSFFLLRYGIKRVMLIAMFAWVLRFGFFGIGTTETTLGVIALIASCLVYGVAFDFFNVSGAMFVQQEAPKSMQGSAQGLFMLMTNGIGASVGTYIAGLIVDKHCMWAGDYLVSRPEYGADGWQITWFIFAAYALVVALAFWVLFRYKHTRKEGEMLKH